MVTTKERKKERQARNMNVLGIDIGGTNFRLGIVREDLSLAK